MSEPSPSGRSRLWSENGEPPNWLLVGSLLTGVVAVAVVAIQLYLNRLSRRDDPTAGVPVVQKAQRPAAGSPPARSPVAPSPSKDPPEGPSESIPASAPSGPPSTAQVKPTESSPTQVTAARVGTGSGDATPRPEIKDRWPELEATLGTAAESANKRFQEYAASNPPRNAQRRPLSLCVIGELSQTEERLLLIVREYLGITFDTPIRVQRRIASGEVPVELRRFDERFNDLQLDSAGLLREVLAPRLSADSYAIVGVTTVDLFPLPTTELLEGQGAAASHASLFLLPHHPQEGPIAAAEARRIVLSGLAEGFRGIAPLYGLGACPDTDCLHHAADVSKDPEVLLCPACLHSLCWNLEIEPEALLRSQQRFFIKYGLRDEAAACQTMLRRLARGTSGVSPEE